MVNTVKHIHKTWMTWVSLQRSKINGVGYQPNANNYGGQSLNAQRFMFESPWCNQPPCFRSPLMTFPNYLHRANTMVEKAVDHKRKWNYSSILSSPARNSASFGKAWGGPQLVQNNTHGMKLRPPHMTHDFQPYGLCSFLRFFLKEKLKQTHSNISHPLAGLG